MLGEARLQRSKSDHGAFYTPVLVAVRIMAKIPTLSAAGSVGHAFATSARSGDSLAKCAKKRDGFSASDS
jgi:hypothetical protein